MTTSPVMSVTDELIAELESVAHSNDADRMEVHGISVGIVRALLAERAELKRDAERYRWLRDKALISTETAPAIMVVDDCGNPVHKGAPWNSLLSFEDADAAIDAAMNPEAKP